MFNLHKGDTIGIISPSAPVAGYCPKRFNRGVNMLRAMGYQVRIGENALKINGCTAGSVKERVDDIHSLFGDKNVKAIICTIGGYNANDLLDKLDYEYIARNKKIFIGYSDITVLLSALHTLANVPTILGPMILPQFGEYDCMLEFTDKSFQTVLQNIGTDIDYILPQSTQWTEEMLEWDKDDNRLRNMEVNNGWKIINSGVVSGRLIGANLNTLTKLIGTPYIFDLTNSILFLEDDEYESIATMRRMLMQCKQAGILAGVRGYVFGRFQKKSGIEEKRMREMFEILFDNGEIPPVVMDVDFGHTDPMLTLPIGCLVDMDLKKKVITVKL